MNVHIFDTSKLGTKASITSTAQRRLSTEGNAGGEPQSKEIEAERNSKRVPTEFTLGRTRENDRLDTVPASGPIVTSESKMQDGRELMNIIMDKEDGVSIDAQVLKVVVPVRSSKYQEPSLPLQHRAKG